MLLYIAQTSTTITNNKTLYISNRTHTHTLKLCKPSEAIDLQIIIIIKFAIQPIYQ
jgi:hypothetical protein